MTPFPRCCDLWRTATVVGRVFQAVTHSGEGTRFIRNHNAPAVEDLDRLPLPAFDLDARIRDRGGIHLEARRGCPFACTFCSTNDFFRRNFG